MSNLATANDGDLVQQLRNAMQEEMAPLRAQVASLQQQQDARNAATPSGLARVVRGATAAARGPSSDPPPVRRLSWLFGEGQAGTTAAPAAALPSAAETHPPPPQQQQQPRRPPRAPVEQRIRQGILRRERARQDEEDGEDEPADEEYAAALEGQLASQLPADPSLADYFGGHDLPVAHSAVRWAAQCRPRGGVVAATGAV